MEPCVICGRVREKKFMRVGAAGWRCQSVSTCKRRRLDRRNRAEKEERLRRAGHQD